jgi:hypothetical protein
MAKLKTNQEIFDYVARHLIRQGRKSMDPTGRFNRLHAEDGAKSALGVLIDPKHYNKELLVRRCRLRRHREIRR